MVLRVHNHCPDRRMKYMSCDRTNSNPVENFVSEKVQMELFSVAYDSPSAFNIGLNHSF